MEQSDSLIMPLKSLSLPCIEDEATVWLNNALEVHSAADVWVLLKQMEAFIETAKKQCKDVAFDSIGQTLGGATRGEVLGHEVKLTYPSRWIYSQEVSALDAQQKLEMKALKAKEEAEGTATKGEAVGTITVTLRK